MKKEYVIRNEKRFCPYCDEEHEVKLLKKKQQTTIKDCDIEYFEYIYYCEKQKEEFEDGEQLDLNLLAMRDAYRVKNGLLTRDEIVAIRKKYDLTQEELSIILGLGEKTIARYETSGIQDKPFDTLLRQFNTNYNFALEMLIKVQDKFKKGKFVFIRNTIRGFINNEDNEYEKMLEKFYICEDTKNSKNGFTILNVDKIKSMFAYFARFTENLFTVKLMKLFWYSDALSYIKTGHAMTGLIYQHKSRGALPIGYEAICGLNSVDRIPIEIKDNICFQFIPFKNDTIDDSLFSSDELLILQKVCEKFKDKSGTELSNIMHDERIYQITENEEILDFSLIKELKAIKL